MKIWLALAACFIVTISVCEDFSSLYRIINTSDCVPGFSDTMGNGIVIDSLPICEDSEFIASVQRVLDSYVYTKSYQANIFDCTQTAQLTWLVLKQNGFDPKIMYSNQFVAGTAIPGDPSAVGHIWVVVPMNEYRGGDFKNWIIFDAGGWVAVETTMYANKGSSHILGEAASTRRFDPEYRTDQGIMFNSSTEYNCHINEGYDAYYDSAPAVEKIDMEKINVLEI